MDKDNIRTSIGMSLMVILSIGAYVLIPFIYIYGFAIILSLIAMATLMLSAFGGQADRPV